jgi:hypothetical protein
MDSTLEEIVQNKLEKYNLATFEGLSKKNIDRLINAEKYLQGQKKEQMQLISKIKENKLTKVSIVKAMGGNISRKTVYNNEILKKYMEKSIDDEEDYFNERKLEKLEHDLKDLQEQYDKVIDNIIEINLIKIQNKEYENELVEKFKKIDHLNSIIHENNKTIELLKLQTKNNNIIKL